MRKVEVQNRAALRAVARDISGNLIVAGLYTAAGIGGLQLTFFIPQVTTVWPASGIALAAVLLFGYRLLPGIWVGSLLAQLWSSGSLLAAFLLPAAPTLAAWISVYLLRRVGFDVRLARLRDAATLIAIGVIANPLIAAAIGPAALVLAGTLPPAVYAKAAGLWWVGDALGILLVTPLVFAVRNVVQTGTAALKAIEAWAVLAIQLALAYAIFFGGVAAVFGTHRLNYFLLPAAILLALRHGPAFTAAANAGVFVIAIWGTAAGFGPFAETVTQDGLFYLHLLVFVLCCTTLLVSAASVERFAALTAARSSADRFQGLTDLASDWYWEQDEHYRVTFMSPRYSARHGLNMPSTLGQTRFETDNIWQSEAHKQAHKSQLDARQPFRDLQLARYDQDGKLHYFLVSGEPVFDAQGRFTGYRGTGREITELKAAEQAARENEARFRSLTELSSDWFWEQDENLRFTFISGRYHDRAGLTDTESLGKTRFELPNEFESEAARQEHLADLAARRPFRELLLHRRDTAGQPRWALVSGEPIFDEHNRFKGYRGVGRDVTRQKLAEAALRQSEERFRSLTELSSDWYWEQNADLRFTFLSPAVEDKTGVAAASRIGMRRWAVPGLEFEEGALEAHKAQLAARQPFRDFVYKRVHKDGGVVWISVTGRPIYDASGRFLGYRGIGRDVSAERLADRRLARLRDYYAALSEANNAIIHAHSPQALFDMICDIAVTQARFLFAWVGVLNETTGWLEPAAMAGRHSDYPNAARFSSDASRPEGRSTVGQVLRTGEPFISNDSLAEPLEQPRHAQIRNAGIHAHADFPLKRGGRVAGTLHLYSAERGVFDPELIELLNRIAQNLSFALDGFDRETARRGAELALRESERRFRDIAEVAGEFVWENDLDGRFSFVSPKVSEVLGYTAADFIGHTMAEFMPQGEPERMRMWFAEHMQPDRSFRGLEHQVISKSGQTLWLSASGVSIWDDNGQPLGHRGTTRDVTELKRSEARVSYLATRDPLTELPNRLLFNDRLEQGVISARRANDSLAVLFIDLDRFKNINDSLGHHIGDLMLKDVASRMSGCIRSGDTLARLGGDEFVIVLEHLRRAEDAAQVTEKIVQALARPIEVGGHTLNISASIGISIYPIDADDGATLMKNADTAMYHAKEKGRNNFQFFSPDMNARAVERHQLEVSLRRALERNEFALLYQPQVDIRTGKVTGAEALIRWNDPERGLIAPSGFISVAEESGLIEPIGRWVLMEACSQARRWQDDGLPPIRIGINISARQLIAPHEFVKYVNRVLDETGLEPSYLDLEMTESLLLNNVEENAAALRKLGKLGVRISVDDFGTGYSSLAYLKQLPIDTLKIDRTFVRDIETDPEDAAIITAVIAMAHGLKLRVTAEGVETRGQLQALSTLGCDEYQGYLLSRPVDAEVFGERFLTRGKARVVR